MESGTQMVSAPSMHKWQISLSNHRWTWKFSLYLFLSKVQLLTFLAEMEKRNPWLNFNFVVSWSVKEIISCGYFRGMSSTLWLMLITTCTQPAAPTLLTIEGQSSLGQKTKQCISGGSPKLAYCDREGEVLLLNCTLTWASAHFLFPVTTCRKWSRGARLLGAAPL